MSTVVLPVAPVAARGDAGMLAQPPCAPGLRSPRPRRARPRLLRSGV